MLRRILGRLKMSLELPMSRCICLLAFVFLLAACSEPPRNATPTPASTATAGDDASATTSSVVFGAQPASIRACDAIDGNATVSLSWDARSKSVGFVTIMVGDQVFAKGASTGTAATGNWVRADTVFTLLDAGSRKTLATLQIPFIDC